MSGKRTLKRERGGFGTELTEHEEWETASDSLEVSRTASGKLTWSIKTYARTAEEMREKQKAMAAVLREALDEHAERGPT